MSPLKVSCCETIRENHVSGDVIVLLLPPLYAPLEAAAQTVQKASVTGFLSRFCRFLTDYDVIVCAKSTLTLRLELRVICVF